MSVRAGFSAEGILEESGRVGGPRKVVVVRGE